MIAQEQQQAGRHRGLSKRPPGLGKQDRNVLKTGGPFSGASGPCCPQGLALCPGEGKNPQTVPDMWTAHSLSEERLRANFTTVTFLASKSCKANSYSLHE